MIRQAVILAGGQGKRLRPYTDTVPKSMVTVGGEPIVDHQIRWLATAGVTHVIVSCGYLAEVLIAHLRSASPPVQVIPVVETEPLGRGGGLKHAAAHLPYPAEPWYALNGDVITTFALGAMAESHAARHAHDAHNAVATIALVHPRLPWGVVKTDGGDRVLSFEEAPRAIERINAGVYVFDAGVAELLPERGDHERSTFPALAARGHLYGYPIDGPWRAVDTDKDREEADTFLQKERIAKRERGYKNVGGVWTAAIPASREDGEKNGKTRATR